MSIPIQEEQSTYNVVSSLDWNQCLGMEGVHRTVIGKYQLCGITTTVCKHSPTDIATSILFYCGLGSTTIPYCPLYSYHMVRCVSWLEQRQYGLLIVKALWWTRIKALHLTENKLLVSEVVVFSIIAIRTVKKWPVRCKLFWWIMVSFAESQWKVTVYYIKV